MLHTAAARVGALDLVFVPGPGGRDVAGMLEGAETGAIEAVWLLAADEIDMSRLGRAFVIYQGHHGDAGAHRADVILPGAAYTEKSGTWINSEGRPQRGQRAAFPPGEAKEDWAILRAISAALGQPLPFDTLDALRDKLAAAHKEFAVLDEKPVAEWSRFGSSGKAVAGDAPFEPAIDNFYMTCPLSRSSPTMAECVTALAAASTGATGTDG